MENRKLLEILAQANAHLQNVHVRGKEDLSAMLSAMALVEDVMRTMMERGSSEGCSGNNKEA